MNKARISGGLLKLMPAGIVLVFCLATPAMAGESAGGWRPIYDSAMLYINFAILVFVIVKYGSGPIKAILDGQKQEVVKQIDDVEARKRELLARIDDAKKALVDSSARFDRIKARFIGEGERLREEIIESAGQQSRRMLEMEKKKAESKLSGARKQFLVELVDRATEFALSRLPREVTDSDHENIISNYLSFVKQMAG